MKKVRKRKTGTKEREIKKTVVKEAKTIANSDKSSF